MKRLVIIPAAGRGSRLNSDIPKVLYPVKGKPMIDYLFALYASVVDRFILILHPDVVESVQQHCAAKPVAVEFDVQESPTGMLDAILIPRAKIQQYAPRHIWITWCDQIGVRPGTIQKLASISEQHPDVPLVFPTILRKNPYIHFVRDKQNRITNVLHRREGDDMPEIGEGDLGLFSLSLSSYENDLVAFSGQLQTGSRTRERNFLPFIPWINRTAEVITFPGEHESESIGINDAADLKLLEGILPDEI